jgi:hypothetical protein
MQEQFNQVLIQQLEKQQQCMDHQQKQILDSNKNNGQLLLSLQKLQKVHQETAATLRKKGLFSWLLRRSK